MAQDKDFGLVLQTDFVPSVAQAVSLGREQFSVVLEIILLFYAYLGFDRAREKENREQKKCSKQ